MSRKEWGQSETSGVPWVGRWSWRRGGTGNRWNGKRGTLSDRLLSGRGYLVVSGGWDVKVGASSHTRRLQHNLNIRDLNIFETGHRTM